MTNINKKCLECGDMFCKKKTESQKYWISKKYCSSRCSLIHTSVKVLGITGGKIGQIAWNKGRKLTLYEKSKMNLSGLILGRTKGLKRIRIKNRLEIICSQCGNKLMLEPNQIRSRNFCNRKCWSLGTRGKGSPVYKGEQAVSRLRNRIGGMSEHKEWHAFILKRDGYKCILCGSKKELEVDHIKRFLLIANEYKIITIEAARDCAELWDTNNGRTLCKVCHRTTNTYGTKGLKSV